jgi:HEAT repeat protein
MAQTAPVPATSPNSASSLQILTDPHSSQSDRDEAARKLVSSHDESMVPPLVAGLTQPDSGIQLAVASALGDVSWPQPEFVEPLFSLLVNREGQRARVRAAAAALSHYKGNTDVLQRLTTIADSNLGDDVRVPVIMAIGSFNQKLAAQTLIDLQQRTDSDAVERAAGDALMGMTGLDDLGHNVQAWKQWWDKASNLSDADFQAEIRGHRADAFEPQVEKEAQLEASIIEVLNQEYEALPTPKDKANLLIQYMRSASPTIRAEGANIVYIGRQSPDGAPPGTMEQVRGLLDDISPDVRAAAAQALFNDADSAPAMVQRLSVERDDLVRVELIKSLTNLYDPAAVALMIQFVQNDPSALVRINSANGIAEAAKHSNLFADRDREQQVVTALLAALKTTGEPGSETLRAAIVGAMAALHDPQLLQTFQSLLDPREVTAVRVNAITGLGGLKNPEVSDSIAAFLNDPDPDIRGAAVVALGTTVQPIYITNLLNTMSKDSEESVRLAAWNVLKGWIGDLDEQDLATLADAVKSEDADKRLAVLEALRDRLIKDIQSATDDAKRQSLSEALAAQRQNVGDCMMDLGQYGDAADQYQQALTYWKANGGKPDVIDTLQGNVVQALIKAQRYSDAAGFASAVIQQYGNDPTMKFTLETIGSKFLVEAENLTASTDPADYDKAAALFAAVDKMAPPLTGSYHQHLSDLEQQLNQKRAGHGSGSN